MTTDPTEERVLAAVRERRERVNAALDEDLPLEEPERLWEASRYLLKAGGKRLRPTVSLLAAEAIADVPPLSVDYRQFPALDGDDVDVMAGALSLEIIQSFTLIHDDIMDDDALRRGVPSVHEAYDVDTAILAGDTLYSTAFEIMAETGAAPENGLEAMRMLANTCTRICEGQALDIEFEHRKEVLPEEYLEMVESKTAVLYGDAAATPAVLLDADDAVVDALYDYGIHSGSAFQIQDDVLDLTVPSEQLGKQRGSDLVENKETLITLHARQQGVDVDSLVDAADAESLTDAAVESAVERLHEAGSIEYAREKARSLVEQGKADLGVLPDNDARALLDDLAEYLISRGY
ncbi:geranylfarnesyl diphosphate synthase [Haloplanus pelagicus]|jgi:geranylgeranyl diphosphate synthase type I|uniref:geranylfarnesyl diphosphate synthase n=1 Tax=Haloplanus pelagicus TaxID=2949995 RepID=UPI00203BA151|nr:polyprenyl synthetase family protein [Haloplanus sp. HW8-1]